MRIGVCTSDFKPPLSAETLFAKIKAHGFESVQLSFASVAETGFTPDGRIEIPDTIPAAAVREVKEAAVNHGLAIFSVNGTFNMAHPDASVREEGLRRLPALCKAAVELGCAIITLCSGTRNTDHLWAYHPDNETEGAWADMIETLKRAARVAEGYGVTLAVETEAANIIDTPEKARKMLDEVNSERLRMVMDCANLFRRGEARRENVIPFMKRAFAAFGRDVTVAHGKDIRESGGIEFCPTGEGIVDYGEFAGLLKEYGYTGDMILHGIYDENKMAAGIAIFSKNI